MDLKTFLIFLISVKISFSYVEISMIDNFLEEYSRNRIIVGFLCDKKDAAEVMKYFSRKLIQINIVSPNISEIPFPIPSSSTHFLLDLSCPSSKKILNLVNREKLFAYPFKWLIYNNHPNEIDQLIEKYFYGYDLLVDSDVTLAIKQKDDLFVLYKIYKQKIKSSFIIEALGNWTKKEGIMNNNFEKITYIRRRNLNKTILNSCIVITNNDSLNHLTDKRDIHIDSIAKVNYVLVMHLSDIVNAVLNYSIRGTWGYKEKNGSWSGMIGELTRKEADIGGTALFLTSDRIKIIDYIAMTTPTRSKFIFRQPKLSYVTNVFTLPFDKNVWGCICAMLLLIAVIFYFGVKWEWRKKEYVVVTNETNENEIQNSWVEVAFETYSVFCQQGSSAVPYSVSGRITLIFLLISFMFLYTSYSANIVALLQSSSTSIQTLEDILHSRLDVGVDDTVFNHFYFPNATEPIRKALYQQKVAPGGQKPKFYHIEDGIRRMRNGLFAFHVETGPGYKFVSEIFQEDEKCGLQEIQFLQVPDPWLAIQKNSSYKKMLKVGLRLLQESGIQEREVGLIYTKKPQCLSRGSSFISVGLVDCYPAAVVLVGGLIAAFVIFIFEIYISKRFKHLKKIFKRFNRR